MSCEKDVLRARLSDALTQSGVAAGVLEQAVEAAARVLGEDAARDVDAEHQPHVERTAALALAQIRGLVRKVIQNAEVLSEPTARHHLLKCWELKACREVSCPAFGKVGSRCWLIGCTFCNGKVQRQFAHKLEGCLTCDVFERACPTEWDKVHEEVLIMLAVIDGARREQAELVRKLMEGDKLATIGTLAAGLVHEINNPLGSVLSNLRELAASQPDLLAAISTLQEGAGPAVERARLQRLHGDLPHLVEESIAGLERVNLIIGDLKGFSRTVGDPFEDVDLNRVIESALNLTHHELKYTTRVERRLSTLPPVAGVPYRLGQVLVNLLVNAAQSMERARYQSNRLIVSTGLAGAEVFVRVEDTGRGISPDHLDRIFEPFFTTKPRGLGTGLGLAISRDIVSQHGGRIDVVSASRGTAFTILLPIRRDAPMAVAAPG